MFLFLLLFFFLRGILYCISQQKGSINISRLFVQI